MTIITSIVTGNPIELEWDLGVQEWRDVPTEPVEVPQGPEWVDHYLALMLGVR